MKIVKNKNLLTICILSMFLVQIINSAAKPTVTNYQINPFVMLKHLEKLNATELTKVTYFSTFNAALAISSLNTPTNNRTVSLDNASSQAFFGYLNKTATEAYSSTNKNAPMFNAPRYIYGKFSQNGAVLTFYTDKDYTTLIANFALPNPQQGEYISTLLWHTDAYLPKNTTNDPKIVSDGYIAGSIPFFKKIATNNSAITLELVNPNDTAYKQFSQCSNFTNLAFWDSTEKNSINFDSSATNRTNIIYNCKDTQSYSNGIIINNFLKGQGGPYSDHEGFSLGYQPSVIIVAYSLKNILIRDNYNVMYIDYSHGVILDTTVTYQEQTRGEYYQGIEKGSLINIAKITGDFFKEPIILQAPIIPNNFILFYFNTGYNPKDGPKISNQKVGSQSGRIYIDGVKS